VPHPQRSDSVSVSRKVPARCGRHTAVSTTLAGRATSSGRQPRARSSVIGALCSAANRAPIHGNDGARPPLAHLEARPELPDDGADPQSGDQLRGVPPNALAVSIEDVDLTVFGKNRDRGARLDLGPSPQEDRDRLRPDPSRDHRLRARRFHHPDGDRQAGTRMSPSIRKPRGVILPARRFIDGLPMKLATKVLTGRS
jgi:hypothetical protein